MSLIQAIILAAVQGLTEFLPVSSSAHLVLFPWLFHWPDPGQAFDVALHAGTLLAVVAYFLKDWVELTLAGLGLNFPPSASPEKVEQLRRMFWLLVLGTIPGAVVGFLFEHRIEDTLRRPVPIAVALIVVALIMWYAESTARMDRKMPGVNLGDAVTIGTAQAFALFPGVSRSGITIAAGLFRGMTRQTAARFSFVLSTPLIAGAAAKELAKLIHMHKAGALDLPVSTLGISVAVSAIVGYAVIGLFLQFLQTQTFKIFIYYRIVLGIVILLLWYLPMGLAR